ncbi:tail fiber domain-containing protein [Chryseobacterium herbae]|uniref:Tail fiber domain-containing protein n=1 Tax=Chryseobacterium herbae TaxID=2976476 RepID=A0ABT2INL8_9FLAO|nr:tail fiber domain-containing protein [Chryseobacterium sp. pc1-10]MCT2560409.1 tail fiber domain-containing protein [Chryseobacterium sp. pc1-10]
MKKIILPIIIVASGCIHQAKAQVGINTTAPASTLDVIAKNATGTTTTPEGLLIPRIDRQRAQSMTGVPTSTLVYVNSIATGTATGTAANIDAIGYYFYNGTAWAKLGSDTNTNIYTNDGTLAGNRIVTQAANTLAFTGTAINAFSVDGTTLSVDAENNRVGVGTAAPGQALGVVDAGNTNQFNGIASFSANNLTAGVGIGWEGIQTVGSRTDIPLHLNAKGAGHLIMQNSGTTGNVGINTTTPSSTFDVTAKNATGTTTKAEGLLIPRVDRERAQSMTGVPTSTLVYVNSIATGTASGIAANIDAIGYYFYNGTAWAKLGSDSNTNIYTNNGTLAGNRIVTQGANTLAFTGSATNAFSVDGTTLSVDAENNRVGVGTAAPGQALGVVDAGNTNQFNGIASFSANNLTAGVGIGWEGIQTVGSRTDIPLHLNAKGAGHLIMQNSGTTGNVGINTTTPSSTLDVTAKNATGTTTKAEGLLIPRVDRERAQSMTGVPTSTLVYVNSIVTGTATGTASNIDAIGYYFYNGTAWAKLGSDTNTNIYTNDGTLAGNRIVTQGTNTLAFNGTAINAFSVDGTTLSVDATNNRVGVGTAAPGQALGVVDAGNTNQFNGIASFFANNLTAGVSIGWEGIQTVGSRTDIPLHLNAKGAGNLIMQNSGTTGNVGVGTTTPGQRVSVVDAGNANQFNGIASFSNNNLTQGVGIGFGGIQSIGTNANVNLGLNARGTGDIIMQTNGTTGRVGIGTATPLQALSVVDAGNGNQLNGIASFVANNLTAGISIGWEGIQSVGTRVNVPLHLNARGTEHIVMQTSGTGNVGIGTAAPTQRLHVNGNVLANAYNTPSDIRLKKEITNNVYGLKEVLGVRTINYRYKDEQVSKDKKIGFVAQEIKASMPELVTTASDEMKTLSVNYPEMTVVLTKAVQELREIVQKQQQEIEALKSHLKHK